MISGSYGVGYKKKSDDEHHKQREMKNEKNHKIIYKKTCNKTNFRVYNKHNE